MGYAIVGGTALLVGWWWGGFVMPWMVERRVQKSFRAWRRIECRELTEQAQEVVRILEGT